MRALLAAMAMALATVASAAGQDWPEPGRYIQNEASCADDFQAFCTSAIKTFPADYAAATQGDYQGQRNVAFCLQSGCEGAVRVMPIAACAWRIVILESGHLKADELDEANFRNACDRLDLAANRTARRQAGTMLDLISDRQIQAAD